MNSVNPKISPQSKKPSKHVNPLINFAISMIKRRPWLFLGNTILGIIITAVDGLAIISIAPIVSSLIGGAENSRITNYFF